MTEEKVIKAKTVAITVVVLFLVAAAIFFGILYSGVVDVSAYKPHFALTKWVLETGLDRSVEVHSAGVTAPAAYTSAQYQDGFRKFDEVCTVCHPVPGKDRTETSKGMRPQPPDLKKTIHDLGDNEIFWIVKNGIKFTGMPAYGKTQTDEKIWELVAFAKTLPDVSPQRYSELQERLRSEPVAAPVSRLP